MKTNKRFIRCALPGLAVGLVALGGCSDTEDVRVSLCKNLSSALQPAGHEIEWTGQENTFNRPAYAITALTFDVTDADGNTTAMRSGCHYAYEALDDTAITLADPLSAYATLPFKMTVNGESLSDGDLLALVNAEQRRLGKKAVDTLQAGASEAVDAVKAGASEAADRVRESMGR